MGDAGNLFIPSGYGETIQKTFCNMKSYIFVNRG